MLKQVGDTAINPIHKSTCHCGAVELEIQLPEGIVEPRRCNCSICRRKGAVVGSVPLSGLKIVKGENKLGLYQFDTKEAEHYFCSVCGIYTHHKRRSNPNQYGINLGCLEGVDPNLIEGVKIHDGANNHPSDKRAS
ncbi:MAG: GFA family protein [Gammaproteobacteria bacterium]